MNIQQQLEEFYKSNIPKLLDAARLEKELDLKRYSCPQLPYVGDNYLSAAVKIMTVGKAPNGWDADGLGSLHDICKADPLPDLIKCSREFVLEWWPLPYFSGEAPRMVYMSLFWQRIYLLVPAILGRTSCNPEKMQNEHASVSAASPGAIY
jgi:hypothetical protein